MTRLIDADELKKCFSLTLHGREVYNAEEILMTIQTAPTIEVEPVRHGKWIPKAVSSGRDSWECSECGRRARGKIENLPYCHCGAKMDL